MAEAKKNTETAEKTAENMVKIKLPRNRKEEDDMFVSVNERTWIIKRGVEVEVPECVAEVIRNSELMQEEAYEFDKASQS